MMKFNVSSSKYLFLAIACSLCVFFTHAESSSSSENTKIGPQLPMSDIDVILSRLIEHKYLSNEQKQQQRHEIFKSFLEALNAEEENSAAAAAAVDHDFTDETAEDENESEEAAGSLLKDKRASARSAALQKKDAQIRRQVNIHIFFSNLVYILYLIGYA